MVLLILMLMRTQPDPFNEYGITKLLKIFKEWQKDQMNRTLVIIRPTVVFGEKNREMFIIFSLNLNINSFQ